MAKAHAKFYLESYGCSLSRSEGIQIEQHLIRNGFAKSRAEDADLLIVGACAVKETTEKRMLSRISLLKRMAKKDALVVAFGCLSKISPGKINAISEEVILIGPELQELSELLGIENERFSPLLAEKEEGFTAIVPIALGCMGNCSYCAVRFARGPLRSYKVKEIVESIKSQLPKKKEFWLTAQDTGCYGFDRETNLAELVKEIIAIDGKFKLRLGMMNPKHLKKIMPKLLPLFESEKLYRFLHIPVQSGSDRVLEGMNRGYKAGDFLELVEEVKKKYRDFTIATDIIVGFPGETEEDFRETLGILEKARPCIVNISRFGPRPETEAASMKQIDTKIRKERSKRALESAMKIVLDENKKIVGKEEEVYISENGKGNTLVGRTRSYRPVILKDGKIGEFRMAKVTKAVRAYLEGQTLDF